MSFQVPAALLLMQLPDNVPGKATKYSLSLWASSSMLESWTKLQRERKTPISWFTSQMPVKAGDGPGQSQEPGTPAGSPTAVRNLNI